jgi:hypothetical protein
MKIANFLFSPTLLVLVFSCSETSNKRLTFSSKDSAEQSQVNAESHASPSPTVTPGPSAVSTSPHPPSPSSTPRATTSVSPTPSPSASSSIGVCSPVVALLNEALDASNYLSSSMDDCDTDADCVYLPSAIRCTIHVCSSGCGIAVSRSF